MLGRHTRGHLRPTHVPAVVGVTSQCFRNATEQLRQKGDKNSSLSTSCHVVHVETELQEE